MIMNALISKPMRVPINLLSTQAVCEYLIYLEYVKGFRAPGTKEMLQGTKSHAMLNTNAMGLLTSGSKVSISDALLLAKSDARETKQREVTVTGRILRGRIDEICIGQNKIKIIDDKPCSTAYQSYINQVFGYCSAFKQQYKPEMPIYGVLRNHKTGSEIFSELFSESKEEYIDNLAERILGIMKGDIRANPVGVVDVCRSCNFNYLCYARTR